MGCLLAGHFIIGTGLSVKLFLQERPPFALYQAGLFKLATARIEEKKKMFWEKWGW
jgi:hypothetical protein